MTWNLFVGRESVLDVSGSTRDIGVVVARELESGKPGSTFPHFQGLFDQEASIAVRDLQYLQYELSDIYSGLIPVPYPVASYWIGDVEIGFTAKRAENEPLYVFERDKFGIDDEGLYVVSGGEIFEDISKSNKIHVFEQRRGQRYFGDFFFGAEGRFPPARVDRVVYVHKSALWVFEDTLSKLSCIAEYAHTKRKPIRGPDA